jgi:hypothetical protein
LVSSNLLNELKDVFSDLIFVVGVSLHNSRKQSSSILLVGLVGSHLLELGLLLQGHLSHSHWRLHLGLHPHRIGHSHWGAHLRSHARLRHSTELLKIGLSLVRRSLLSWVTRSLLLGSSLVVEVVSSHSRLVVTPELILESRLNESDNVVQ